MSSTAADAGEFSLLIVEADPSMVDEAAESLAEAFHLDPAVAQQVVKAVPIVFARGLTKYDALPLCIHQRWCATTNRLELEQAT